jgi:hypothetical protein
MKDETPEQTMLYAAHGLHELYDSYVRAGFSEVQALELVKVALAVGLQRGKDK